jgi:ankyrin repeat protein
LLLSPPCTTIMETVLLVAEDGTAKLSDYLETNGVSVNVAGGDYENTALLEAARRKNHTAVCTLVYEGADLYAANGDGDTALIIAARLGCKPVVEVLLENGCEASTFLNQRNFDGRSALFEACSEGHGEVAALLLDSQADPISSDDAQNSCLMQACRVGHASIVCALLELGAHPATANEAGETALSIACEAGHGDIAKLLKQYKA